MLASSSISIQCLYFSIMIKSINESYRSPVIKLHFLGMKAHQQISFHPTPINCVLHSFPVIFIFTPSRFHLSSTMVLVLVAGIQFPILSLYPLFFSFQLSFLTFAWDFEISTHHHGLHPVDCLTTYLVLECDIIWKLFNSSFANEALICLISVYGLTL